MLLVAPSRNRSSISKDETPLETNHSLSQRNFLHSTKLLQQQKQVHVSKNHSISGFQTFARLNSILGFHMQQFQRRATRKRIRIQGAITQCSHNNITVKPCPMRIQRILEQSCAILLHAEQMLSEQARRLAGKSSFATTHLFGRVGRSDYARPMTKHIHSKMFLGVCVGCM